MWIYSATALAPPATHPARIVSFASSDVSEGVAKQSNEPAMMNGNFGGWYSDMGTGGWMFGILILVVVVAALVAIVGSRKK